MVVHVQTKDDNRNFFSSEFETVGNLVLSYGHTPRSFLIAKQLCEN